MPFDLGFKRVAEAEPALVGKEYEENEDGGGIYGFSSHTTANPDGSFRGMLFWNRIWNPNGPDPKNNYEDTIEYILVNPLPGEPYRRGQRYKWEDPHLVPMGTPPPLAGQKPPHPTPKPTPTPPPTPPSPDDLGSSFEGLEQIKVADFGRTADAISRAVDSARDRQVWLLFHGGEFRDRRGRTFPPNVRVRMAAGGQVERDGDREGTLWRVQADCRDLILDDNYQHFGPYSQIPVALEIAAPGITVDGLVVKDHLGMGWTCNDRDVTLRRARIYGPRGTGCVGSEVGGASWGAMWTGPDAARLHLNDYFATGEGGGGIFTEATDFLFENLRLDDCCLGFTQDMNNPSQHYGGGQVCVSRKARGGILRNLDVSSNGSNWASGLELDGDGTTVDGAKLHGHTLRHGAVVQHGVGNKLYRVESFGNRVGCSVEREASNTVIDSSCSFHDNLETDLDDRGVNTKYS